MNKLIALLLCTFVAASAHAERLSLKCKTGESWQDMLIDVEKRSLNWFIFGFDITKVTDQYITAVRKESKIGSDVGADVLVFDRAAGSFELAGLHRTCRDERCRVNKIVPHTNRGVCKSR